MSQLKTFLSTYWIQILLVLLFFLFIVYPIYHILQRRKDLNQEYELLKETHILFEPINDLLNGLEEYVSDLKLKPNEYASPSFKEKREFQMYERIEDYCFENDLDNLVKPILKNCYALRNMSAYGWMLDSPIRKYGKLNSIYDRLEWLTEINTDVSNRLTEIEVKRKHFSISKTYKDAVKRELNSIASAPKNLLKFILNILKVLIVVLLVSTLL